jgi:hypothetical protein
MSNSYDAWLERPYTERAARDAALEGAEEVYAEYHDLDDDEMAEVDSDTIAEWYEEWMLSAAEDAAVERAEALRDDYEMGRFDPFD